MQLANMMPRWSIFLFVMLRPIMAPGCINQIAVGKRLIACAVGKASSIFLPPVALKRDFHNFAWFGCVLPFLLFRCSGAGAQVRAVVLRQKGEKWCSLGPRA